MSETGPKCYVRAMALLPIVLYPDPVLLKPTTDVGAQVILQGRVHGNMKALEYHAFKKVARDTRRCEGSMSDGGHRSG